MPVPRQREWSTPTAHPAPYPAHHDAEYHQIIPSSGEGANPTEVPTLPMATLNITRSNLHLVRG